MSHSRMSPAPKSFSVPAHAELWARIEAFDPDEPGVAVSFSQRLARENGWSHLHALRVIGEYRRFLFLAVTAGHPVSPSDTIDQAWHLHLTYTRSYWETLCGEVLRQPFHHQPTRGGSGERAKFQDWYTRTLASYRAAFNELPPADLWPASALSSLPAMPEGGSENAPKTTRSTSLESHPHNGESAAAVSARTASSAAASSAPAASALPRNDLRDGFRHVLPDAAEINASDNTPHHPLRRRAPQFRRVDVSQYWMIPRPSRDLLRRFQTRSAKVTATVAGLTALLVIAGCQGDGKLPGANVFDMRGPDFLWFYIATFIVSLVVALIVRSMLRYPGGTTAATPEEAVDPYVVAYLSGRETRVATTALARLAGSNSVQIKSAHGRPKITRTGAMPFTAHPIEEHLHQNLPQQRGVPLDDVVHLLKPVCAPLEEELESQGWVIPARDRFIAWWLPAAIAVFPLVLGMIKIFVGLSRGKPVSLLVLLCIGSAIILLFAFARRPWISRRGENWLESLRTQHDYLRSNATANQSQDLALAVGLFGVMVLTNTSMADVARPLMPIDSSSSTTDTGWSIGGDGWSSSDSSSSSSDSGSSSSDSGGGDSGGGSGCGGCGGGGGGD